MIYHFLGTKLNYASGDGSMIVPRNCLHSIIRLLNKLLKEADLINHLANSFDMSYEIIYTLCTNPLYNQELLAYLRNEYDFIYKHLKLVPFDQEHVNETSEHEGIKPSVYLQNCWVLNLACIEMQSLTANKQKGELKKLIQLLIENTELSQSISKPNTSLVNKSTFLNQSTFMNSTNNFEDSKFVFNKTSDRTMESKTAKNNYNNKIFDVLLMASLAQESAEVLNLNYFDPALIEKVIDTCKTKPDFVNMKLYDLNKVSLNI